MGGYDGKSTTTAKNATLLLHCAVEATQRLYVFNF
jgi:hypothetical protein